MEHCWSKAGVQDGYRYSDWLKSSALNGMMKHYQLGLVQIKKKQHISVNIKSRMIFTVLEKRSLLI